MSQLQDLQDRIGRANESHGFNDYKKFETDEERNLYLGNKLMLVVSELAEAQEELRAGHAPQERYFSPYKDGFMKPEGVPAEMADALIRLLGIFYEIDVDAEDVIDQKVTFNEARAFKHGKQF